MTEDTGNGWKGRIEERVNNLVKSFDDHVSHNTEEMKEMKAAIDWVRSKVWMGLGGLAVLQIVIYLLLKKG